MHQFGDRPLSFVGENQDEVLVPPFFMHTHTVRQTYSILSFCATTVTLSHVSFQLPTHLHSHPYFPVLRFDVMPLRPLPTTCLGYFELLIDGPNLPSKPVSIAVYHRQEPRLGALQMSSYLGSSSLFSAFRVLLICIEHIRYAGHPLFSILRTTSLSLLPLLDLIAIQLSFATRPTLSIGLVYDHTPLAVLLVSRLVI